MADAQPLAAQPRVSIVIVAYNQEDFIAEAIESAVRQNYDNLEVVVADDASTDRTPEIVRDFARRYPDRVVAVLNAENRGVTENSNAGLREATGELIAFMGGDDVLLPGKVAAQVAWFKRNPAAVLCGHKVEMFYEDGSPSEIIPRRLFRGVGVRPYIRHRPFPAMSIMVRRDRIPAYGFNDAIPLASDQALWFDVVGADGQFGYIDGVWSRYRRHDRNASAAVEQNLRDTITTLRIASEKFPFAGREIAYARASLNYVFGVMHLKNGDRREARRLLWESLSGRPFNPKTWIRLGQVYLTDCTRAGNSARK